MSTPVLNNGIFMRETSVNASSHLDSYHLLNMLGDIKPTDFGVIDLWAQSQKVEMPLYQMSNFGGKNIVVVDDNLGRWTWKSPMVNDLPYIVENIEGDNAMLGKAGTTFKIKLNERAFGHGDIISYDKMNGTELFITADEILPVGDGYVYTVQVFNSSDKAFDPKFLQPGVSYTRKGSAIGEYGESYSDLSVKSGYREYYNEIGNAEAHVHYSLTGRADMIARGGLNKDGSVPITEIWKVKDQSLLDPSIVSFQDLKTKLGNEGWNQAVGEGRIAPSFLTSMEAAHLTKLAEDIERYLMWGQGGLIKTDGMDDVRLAPGLWKQLESSHRKIYNKHSFNLDMFQNELYNFFNGRVEFDGPDPKRKIVIQTGIAGMRMVNKAIQDEAHSQGLVIQAGSAPGIGAIRGQGMNLGYGYAYTSYVIPFIANVEFVLNPAFDNVNTNDIENPKIDGYPLSSYSFVVFDVTDNAQDNIYLMKRESDKGLKWFYQNGDTDYMGRQSGFASSGLFPGYKVYMRQAYPSIWVKDPTKILKFVMRNPITGGSF